MQIISLIQSKFLLEIRLMEKFHEFRIEVQLYHI